MINLILCGVSCPAFLGGYGHPASAFRLGGCGPTTRRPAGEHPVAEHTPDESPAAAATPAQPPQTRVPGLCPHMMIILHSFNPSLSFQFIIQ